MSDKAELLIALAGSVSMLTEAAKRFFATAMPWLVGDTLKLALFLLSIVFGVIIAFLNPQATEVFEGFGLEAVPAVEYVILGLVLGLGSKVVYFLLDILSLLRKYGRTTVIAATTRSITD